MALKDCVLLERKLEAVYFPLKGPGRGRDVFQGRYKGDKGVWAGLGLPTSHRPQGISTDTAVPTGLTPSKLIVTTTSLSCMSITNFYPVI